MKDTGESISTCGFHCWNRETGEVKIGYDLYRRQGYMTEALTRIIDFAKTEICVKKIYAHIPVDILPSVKAVEKQGFEKTDEHYDKAFHGENTSTTSTGLLLNKEFASGFT